MTQMLGENLNNVKKKKKKIKTIQGFEFEEVILTM